MLRRKYTNRYPPHVSPKLRDSVAYEIIAVPNKSVPYCILLACEEKREKRCTNVDTGHYHTILTI
jgi:hypothetical protein